MKKYYLNPPHQPDLSYMDSLFAEMICEKTLKHFQKMKILEEIDESLQKNDKNEFLRLTNKLKKFEE